MRTPAEFENIILRDESGYLVRLARCRPGGDRRRDERVNARFNGRNAVAMGVVKQSTANPLDVSKAVQKTLPVIRAGLPEGMSVDIGYDSPSSSPNRSTPCFTRSWKRSCWSCW